MLNTYDVPDEGLELPCRWFGELLLPVIIKSNPCLNSMINITTSIVMIISRSISSMCIMISSSSSSSSSSTTTTTSSSISLSIISMNLIIISIIIPHGGAERRVYLPDPEGAALLLKGVSLSLYIYIYMYMHIYIYMFYVYIYIYIHIHMYTCI